MISGKGSRMLTFRVLIEGNEDLDYGAAVCYAST